MKEYTTPETTVTKTESAAAICGSGFTGFTGEGLNDSGNSFVW